MLLVRYLSTENALGAIIGAMFVNRKCSLRAIFVDRNALAEGTWSGHVAGHMRQQSQSCGIALVICKVCDSCHLQSLRLLSFAKFANLVTCKVRGTLLNAHCQSMRKLQFAESFSESTIYGGGCLRTCVSAPKGLAGS